MSTYAPFAKPLYVMLKPVGAVCNLACDYCYYLEKSKLYVNNPKHVMSDELLEKFIEFANNASSIVHLARRRNPNAPAGLLQKSDGTAKEIRQRTDD